MMKCGLWGDEQELPSENYESEYGLRTYTVPEDLMERLYTYITEDEGNPDEREELMRELEVLIGEEK